MNRSSLMDRFGLRRKSNSKHRSQTARLGMEQLEERRLLTAYNVLFSTFFDSHGASVLRYNDATHVAVPGGVATGNENLSYAAGVAVASDGSYYVSSDATAQVLHFSNSGAFVGILGANDTTPAPLEDPGTLAFGPNGNLYVADLGANAIFQFNLTSPTQQYQAAGTLSLPTGFTPGGFAFAPDSTHDIIVGSLEFQSVVEFDAQGSVVSTPIAQGSGIDPASILALSNGNLLIADTDFDEVATAHHQIVEYVAGTGLHSQFINFTSANSPVGTGSFAGDASQPTSLALDVDGNLLVGLSPDDSDDGAVEKFNIQTGALMSTVASGVGDPSGVALVPVESSDLLFSTFFDTNGSSVLRYNDASQLPVPGGVATGNENLSYAAGVAVASDGSYYVSSDATAQVLHFSNSGAFVGILGANDTTPAPLEDPGTLAFGPNGNLYVADLGANAIFQFNLTSPTQQYQAAGTLSLPTGFTPGGFTFAPDGTGNLVVGSLEFQSVVEFDSQGNVVSTPIAQGSGIDPAAILALSNGNLLIADTDFDEVATAHHQIVQYNASTGLPSQFINFTSANAPVGTGAFAGDVSQPTSLALDIDGNLLVGLSPDDSDDGAVEKFNIQTGAIVGTIASGVGDPSGLALAPVQSSDVLFSTFFDTNGNSILRYNDASQLPVPGGVATGTDNLAYTAGVVEAPDGTYYVSSDATAQVLHFNNSGAFLGVLGATDATQAPLEDPGTLAFGPNGNLYVADLAANAIFQFNVNSSSQQYLAADTLSLPTGFTPGGFTFASDSTRNLIVGSLEYQSVVEFNSQGSPVSTLVPQGSGIEPASILALGNGNLLIADTDFDEIATEHHQIAEYNAQSQTTSQFINFTSANSPVGTGVFAGDDSQPTSLMLDADGNLLVGLSPDDSDDGAVEKFNTQTGALIGTIASGVGDPSGLALAPIESSDILFSTFFDSNGNSVLRYNDSTHAAVAGSVATGTGNLAYAAGVAVAPDGSYYVSSDAIAQVMHFSNSGSFLGYLGASDGTPAPMEDPGTLAFGPNGNLYVADLAANAIFQFNTNSTMQQYVAADTLSLPTGFTPGGFTFASDGTRNLIVGSLEFQSVVEFNAQGNPVSTLVPQGSGIEPAAILALGNGNLLIADTDFDEIATAHHQIVEYNAATGTTSQFINFTASNAPVGTGSFAGDVSQPTSLALDADGNLLVGVSPDDSDDGAVEKFNIQSGKLMSSVSSGVGDPSGIALAPELMEMTVTAAQWTSSGYSGLTVERTDDGVLHIYGTGTTTDVVPPQLFENVSEVLVTGRDNAANALTIAYSGGNPIPLGGLSYTSGSGTATNGVIISGDASFSGTIQATGTVMFGQGAGANGTPANSFAIASGTVTTTLSGSGGLSKSGSGEAILSGSNTYHGGTTVTAGTLVLAASGAFPTGSALTVSAGATLAFDSTAPSESSPVVSSSSVATSAAPATAAPLVASSTIEAAAPLATPVPAAALVSTATTALVAPSVTPLIADAAALPAPTSAATGVLSAALPLGQPSSPATKAINELVWKGYTHTSGPAIARSIGHAAYVAWWYGDSSNSQQPASDNRRLAALDAVLAQYGAA